MSQGASSSGSGSVGRGRGNRPREESSEPPRRRGRRRGKRGVGRGEGEGYGEGAIVFAAPGEGVFPPRLDYPQGPRLPTDFAAGWDGHNLVLAPERHISAHALAGLEPCKMRTISGWTTCFDIYSRNLSKVSRDHLSRSAFGSFIEGWTRMGMAKSAFTANLMVLRAFLDRFWDTTNTFHMQGYEAGITLTDFAVISGLPCGGIEMDWEFEPPKMISELVKEWIGDVLEIPQGAARTSFQLKTSIIMDYFQNDCEVDPVDGDDLKNARLWLWWFLGATYLGDKGERVSTVVLRYLADWNSMGNYDWVSPALSLTIKYCRKAVRRDSVESMSKPSLVGHGIIMEAYFYSHFPSLFPAGYRHPHVYPAVCGWALADRSVMTWTYDKLLCLLNDMTYDRPWMQYIDIPDHVILRMRGLDGKRLCLHAPYGSFWHLGERMAPQGSYDVLVVPHDPPSCLFVHTDNPVVRAGFGEGQSTDLLRFGLDYAGFAGSRLARAHIFLPDPDMVHQLDDFPTSVEYEVRGVRRTFALPQTTTIVEHAGMDGWTHRVRKVMGAVHKKLWRTANRWREAVAIHAAALCQFQEDLRAAQAEVLELRQFRDAHR